MKLCWNLARTLLEPCWRIAEVLLVEPCWELLGTSLEPCCFNLWLEHFARNQCGCCILILTLFLALLNVPGCDVGNLAGTLLEQARTDLQPWWNVYEDNFWFCLGAFFLNTCGWQLNLALQGSKVARSRGKVPSWHQDPTDTGFQSAQVYSK